LRYDSLSTVCTQINDDFITADEHVFTLTDTQSIIDTVNYQYDIEYVFSDTTYTQFYECFALKRIDFEVQSDEDINVILEFRKNTDYLSTLYVSLDNTGWDMIGQIIINQTDTLSINPYQYCDYLLIEFKDGSMENPFMGYIKLSMDYLIELIESANTEDELIIDNGQWIMKNYPNPFNPTTTISYELPEGSSNPFIEIYNIKGARVRELKIENCKLKINSIVWDGMDDYRNQVSSGVYLYRLVADGRVLTSQKMILMK